MAREPTCNRLSQLATGASLMRKSQLRSQYATFSFDRRLSHMKRDPSVTMRHSCASDD
jgi:hypothetical protein